MFEQFKNGLHDIIKRYPDHKFVFLLENWETDFLRFYRSMTNYNISRNDKRINITVYKDKKSLSFAISEPDIFTIEQSVKENISMIDHLMPDPDFHDIEDNKDIAFDIKIDNNIEKVPLSKKVEILKMITGRVMEYGFSIFGTFICNFNNYYLLNSNGVEKEFTSSPIFLDVKAVSDINDVTVIDRFGGNIEKFNIDNFCNSIIDKVKIARKEIIDVDPGNYEVILSPACSGTFLGYLMHLATDGALDHKISYFEDKLDQKVFPEGFSVNDDPQHPDGIPFYYNMEGHIYNKLEIVKNGVFKNFMVGNYYSHKLKMKKNGNMGICLTMEKGDKSLQEMIGSVKKGLYISNLHYMNFMNPKETSATGLTRDGTFYIEEGEIKNVVNNLRYTVKIADIFKNILDIEDRVYPIPTSSNYDNFNIHSYIAPHLRVKDFSVTSSTKTI